MVVLGLALGAGAPIGARAGNMGSLFSPDATPFTASKSPLVAHRPLLAAELQRDFPDQYRALGERFEAIYRSGEPNGNAIAAGKAVEELGAKYLTQIHQAPDADLGTIVADMGALHALVLKTEGPKTCAVFSAKGSQVLFEAGVGAPYMERIDALEAAYFVGVAHAMAHPTTTLAPVAADWKRVTQRMLADGGKKSFVGIIARGDTKSAELCPAMVALLKAVTEVRGDAGARLRAAFAVNAIAY